MDDVRTVPVGERVRVSPTGANSPVTGQVLAVDGDGLWILSDGAYFPAGTPVRGTWAAIKDIQRTGHDQLPETIVRIYKGKQQGDATEAFQRESDAFGRAGYALGGQSWAAGQWGCGAFVVAL